MKEQRYYAPPCPMCGKEDGARRGDSSWGHSEACCSDACGRAFQGSVAQAALMLERATQNVANALREQAEWNDALTERIAKGGGK